METKKILESRIGLKLVTIGKMSKVFALQRFSGKNHPITPEQFSVLAALAEQDGMHQSQIAAFTLKDRPNITRIINILEEMELVKRSSGVDRRKVFKVHITPKGREVYEKVLPTILDIWSSTVEGVTNEEMTTTLKVLAKIRENLSNNLNIHNQSEDDEKWKKIIQPQNEKDMCFQKKQSSV